MTPSVAATLPGNASALTAAGGAATLPANPSTFTGLPFLNSGAPTSQLIGGPYSQLLVQGSGGGDNSAQSYNNRAASPLPTLPVPLPVVLLPALSVPVPIPATLPHVPPQSGALAEGDAATARIPEMPQPVGAAEPAANWEPPASPGQPVADTTAQALDPVSAMPGSWRKATDAYFAERTKAVAPGARAEQPQPADRSDQAQRTPTSAAAVALLLGAYWGQRPRKPQAQRRRKGRPQGSAAW